MLLMDEPFDGFDLRQTRSIIKLIRSEAAKGRTFILAIHQFGRRRAGLRPLHSFAGGQVRGIGRSTNCACKPDFGRISGGDFSCAHLRHTSYPRLRCIRCSQRSWRDRQRPRAVDHVAAGLLAVGYSFVQAVSLYSEASAAALQSPVLATSLSPLDGILVPTSARFTSR